MSRLVGPGGGTTRGHPRFARLRLAARFACGALALGLAQPVGAGPDPVLELGAGDRIKVGIGDRLQLRRGDGWVSVLPELDRAGLRPDFLQLWLTREWQPSWVPPHQLRALAARGIVPIVVHYYFGDAISRERFERESDAWYASLRRMADVLRADAPVLVVLEPEFNVDPPPGEHAVAAWPAFGDHLSRAARLLRERAPNVRVGTCVGDFAGPPQLEASLGRAAPDLDFIAFQEMRASTDPAAGRDGYLHVGRSATRYARYLQRAFERPLLVAYVAVSSHGGWEDRQARALDDVHRQRRALRDAGVFGIVYFQLFDDPAHTGYFGPAEAHFGLLRRDGSPKPALEVFKRWSQPSAWPLRILGR
jgi:hypothetical protein